MADDDRLLAAVAAAARALVDHAHVARDVVVGARRADPAAGAAARAAAATLDGGAGVARGGRLAEHDLAAVGVIEGERGASVARELVGADVDRPDGEVHR